MYDRVVDLLGWLGYVVRDSDRPLINFLIKKTEDYAKQSCNILEIPESLSHKLVERVAGEFLNEMRCSGQLEGNFKFEAMPSTIREGDTQVTFAFGEGSYTPEQAFNKMVDFLMNNLERNLSLYRRVRW